MFLINDENKKVRISIQKHGILFEIQPNSEIEIPSNIITKIMPYVKAFRLELSETSSLQKEEIIEQQTFIPGIVEETVVVLDEPVIPVEVEVSPVEEVAEVVEPEVEEQPLEEPPPVKKKRGRPRKVKTEE